MQPSAESKSKEEKKLFAKMVSGAKKIIIDVFTNHKMMDKFTDPKKEQKKLEKESKKRKKGKDKMQSTATIHSSSTNDRVKNDNAMLALSAHASTTQSVTTTSTLTTSAVSHQCAESRSDSNDPSRATRATDISEAPPSYSSVAFSDLPDEILFKIFGYVNFAELTRVKTVCSRFLKMAYDEVLKKVVSELDYSNPTVTKLPLLPSPVTCIDQVSDNQLAVGTQSGTLYFINYDTQKIVNEIQNAHKGSIKCIAKMSDYIIATGSTDRTVRFWNLKNNKCVQTLKLKGPAVALTAYECNKIAVALLLPDLEPAGSCHTIQRWDYKTGKLLEKKNNYYQIFCYDPGQIFSIGQTVVGYENDNKRKWILGNPLPNFYRAIYIGNGTVMTKFSDNMVICGNEVGQVILMDPTTSRYQLHHQGTSNQYPITAIAKFSNEKVLTAHFGGDYNGKLYLLDLTKATYLQQHSYAPIQILSCRDERIPCAARCTDEANIKEYTHTPIPLTEHKRSIKHLLTISKENSPEKYIVSATGGPNGKIHITSFSFLNNAPRASSSTMTTTQQANSDNLPINPLQSFRDR